MDNEMEMLREERLRLFDEWRRKREDAFERGHDRWHLVGREDFVQAWANIAYVAELERNRMGRDLNKLQQRIGRQRAANNKMRITLKEKDAQIDRSYEQREVERAQYEKEIRELREQLARERAIRRTWYGRKYGVGGNT